MDSNQPNTTSNKTIRLRIQGMTCASCVARVERGLAQVDGVTKVAVNLATESAAVEIDASVASQTTLIEAVRSTGYDADVLRTANRQDSNIENVWIHRATHQRQAFVHSLALAVPIVAIHWLAPTLSGSAAGAHIWPQAIQALLCSVLLMSAGGAPILVGGLRALIHWTPNMDLLVSLGVVAAYLAGMVGLIGGFDDLAHFHAAAMILVLINLGRTIEAHVRRRAADAITSFAKRIPTSAILMTEEGPREIPINDIRIGDHVRVAQDALIPVDGVVVDGEAAVDESSFTGEPMGRRRILGEDVYAGTLVTEGLLTIEAIKIGQDSRIGQIIRAVEDAQTGKTRLQRIADRVAGVFVPIVIVLAIASLLGNVWLAETTWGTAIRRCIAVLVISCPCAMGLATPMAIMVAVGSAAARGILIREPAALERASMVDCVLFDKTGTLTTGSPTVKSITPLGGHDQLTDDDLLRLAAAAEQYAQHPIATAIVEEAKQRNLDIPDADSFSSTPGLGVVADIQSQAILVGSLEHIKSHSVDIDRAKTVLNEVAKRGESVVLVSVNKQLVGALSLTDTLRPSAIASMAALKRDNIDLAIVSGDQEPPVATMARQLQIETFRAALTPQQKQAYVQERIDEGRQVAFLGDGVNDAPSLAAAQVGMTFVSGTDVASEAADVSFLHDDLQLVSITFTIAKRCVRVIKQNLFWAFFYNFLAIPLAATGQISPGWAAGAMMFSSITVVLNSLRLRSKATS